MHSAKVLERCCTYKSSCAISFNLVSLKRGVSEVQGISDTSFQCAVKPSAELFN